MSHTPPILVGPQPPAVQHNSLKCICLGNVDSGKSSFVGVVTTGLKDNARGAARARIALHPHEIATGKTSAASHHLFGYTSTGEHVFFNPFLKTSSNNAPATTTAATEHVKINKNVAWNHIVLNSVRNVGIVDLCGHARYLKSSICGAIASMPDLAFLLISPHTGLSLMTIEHISLCIALKLRIVILVTKIDRIDKNNIDILKRLKGEINDFIINQCHRTPLTIKSTEEVDYVLGFNPKNKVCSQSSLVAGNSSLPAKDSAPVSHIPTDICTSSTSTAPEHDINAIVPIFYISSTTLQHYDLLHYYLARVEPITWTNSSSQVVGVTDNEDLIQSASTPNNNNNNNNKYGTYPHGHNAEDEKADSNPHQQHQEEQQQQPHSSNIGGMYKSATSASLVDMPLSHAETTVHRSTSDTYTSNQIHLSSSSSTLSAASATSTLSKVVPSQSQFNPNTTQIASSVTSSSSTAQTSAVAANSFLPMRSRDTTIPLDLINLISFEMRVDERFTKANTGLIVSGTITYGEIDVDSKKRAFLGPFCSHRANTIPNVKPVKSITSSNSNTLTASGRSKKGSGKKNTVSLDNSDSQMLDVEFIPVTIKSLQLYRSQITSAALGESIGICVKYDAVAHKHMQKLGKYRSKHVFVGKDIPKELILRGMVLLALDENIPFPLHKIQSNLYTSPLLLPLSMAFSNTTTTESSPLPPSSTTKTVCSSDTAPKHHKSIPVLSPAPVLSTIKAGGFPYEYLVASIIDIQIDALHPQSWFHSGTQCVLHCSALSIPIIVEKVLAILDPNTNQITSADPSYIQSLQPTTTATPPVSTMTTKSNPNQPAFIYSSTHGVLSTSTNENDLALRYKQRGLLRCRFVHQGFAYIHPTEQILLRDGCTRAFGTVKTTHFFHPTL